MNYYERHLGDYAKDTGHLSALEHGVYTLLLDRYYATEAGIPDSQAHRIARARTRDERAAADAVLSEFFSLVDGVWINGRAEEEIEKAKSRIEAAKENGKRGGRPRKGQKQPENETQQKPGGFSVGSEKETQQKAHQSPITNHQTPVDKTSSSTAEPLPRETPAAATTIPDPPSDPGHWLLWFNASQGLSLDPASRFDRKGFWPLATRWCKAGLTIGTMQSAIDKAVAEAREPIAYLPAYVDRVLATQNAPPPTMTAAASSTLAAARTIFGTDIEDNHAHATGRIIDITPGLAERGDRVDLPRVAGQLRVTVSEPVEDGADHPGRL